jgi:hypothetical protein
MTLKNSFIYETVLTILTDDCSNSRAAPSSYLNLALAGIVLGGKALEGLCFGVPANHRP